MTDMQKKAKNSSSSESSSGSQFQQGELDASSDLLGFEFSKYGCVFAVLAGLMGFAMVAVHTGLQNWLAAANGALFAGCLFWLFRSYLPTALLVRVKDIVRFRFAFLAINLASTLAVLSSPAFLGNYSTVSLSSLCMTAAVVCPFLTVAFFQMQNRLLLALAFCLCGGLCVTHPIGIVSFFSLLFTVFYVGNRCGAAFSRMHCDEAYGEAYTDRMRPVFLGLSIAHQSLILCGFSFILGAGVMICYHTNLSGQLVVSHLIQLSKAIVAGHATKGYLFMMITALVLAVVTNLCSRKASDITSSMTGPFTILFGCAGIFALIWPLGLIKHIPPFSDLSAATLRTQSLLPDIFVASALAVAVAVFLVDSCCRENVGISYSYDDDEVRKISPLMRNIRAVLIIGVLFAFVGFAIYRATLH